MNCMRRFHTGSPKKNNLKKRPLHVQRQKNPKDIRMQLEQMIGTVLLELSKR